MFDGIRESEVVLLERFARLWRRVVGRMKLRLSHAQGVEGVVVAVAKGREGESKRVRKLGWELELASNTATRWRASVILS